MSSKQPYFGIADELVNPGQPVIEDLLISSDNAVIDAGQAYEMIIGF